MADPSQGVPETAQTRPLNCQNGEPVAQPGHDTPTATGGSESDAIQALADLLDEARAERNQLYVDSKRDRESRDDWKAIAQLATGEVVALRARLAAYEDVVAAARVWLAQRRSPDAFVREPRAELIRLADAVDALPQDGPTSPPQGTVARPKGFIQASTRNGVTQTCSCQIIETATNGGWVERSLGRTDPACPFHGVPAPCLYLPGHVPQEELMSAVWSFIERGKPRIQHEANREELLIAFAMKAISRSTRGTWRLVGAGGEYLREIWDYP